MKNLVSYLAKDPRKSKGIRHALLIMIMSMWSYRTECNGKMV